MEEIPGRPCRATWGGQGKAQTERSRTWGTHRHQGPWWSALEFLTEGRIAQFKQKDQGVGKLNEGFIEGTCKKRCWEAEKLYHKGC